MDYNPSKEQSFDLRVMIAHSAAGVFVAEKWVGWARQQVAAGYKTPELLELAAVDPARSGNWHDIENPGEFLLVHPALASLGYDVSNSRLLMEEYALTELTQLFLGQRQLWDAIRDFALLWECGTVTVTFPDGEPYLRMREELRQPGKSRVGTLREIEAAAWRYFETKRRELDKLLLLFYAQPGRELPGDFPAPPVDKLTSRLCALIGRHLWKEVGCRTKMSVESYDDAVGGGYCDYKKVTHILRCRVCNETRKKGGYYGPAGPPTYCTGGNKDE